MIHPLDVILHKRDGLEMSDAEVRAFVDAVVQRTPERALVTDAQIAAWLMAIFQKGLSDGELAALTQAMRMSGDVFDASGLGRTTVDKHSTGGVGDKTSLLVAPICAAAGLAVPMISGRSLGHTGGTLDKLETIPGFDSQLSLDQFGEVLKRCGAALIGQTPAIVPADRVLYGLRDHTGTVESPYLICASIMSKKLAEDLHGLVLDVKTGSGAFMKSLDKAKHLAQLMVRTGEAAGTRTVALLTAMDQPLGRFAGNWVEVWECVDVMRGIRHPMSQDLIELSTMLAGWMLYLGGKANSAESGRDLADLLLSSGHAYKAWLRVIAAQGGDTQVFESVSLFHTPRSRRVITAESDGYLSHMDCSEVGWAVQRLGAGRAKPGDPVSAHAGIEVHAKLGDWVKASEPLMTIFADDLSLLDEPEAMLRATLRQNLEFPVFNALIQEVVLLEH